jgi:hypothetical protein
VATAAGLKISPVGLLALWPNKFLEIIWARPFSRLVNRAKQFMSPPMMIYGRPIRNPRFWLLSLLVGASALLPILGAIA